MAVPKRKTSPMKRGFRRSADALAAPTYVEDKDSGELRRPHHIDLKTGMYRGRQVLTIKSRKTELDSFYGFVEGRRFSPAFFRLSASTSRVVFIGSTSGTSMRRKGICLRNFKSRPS